MTSRQDIVLETNTYDKLVQYPSPYFNGDIMKMYIDVFSNESNQLKQVFYDLRSIRTIDLATGINLDNIGEIVCEPRTTSTEVDTGYFTFQGNIYGSGFNEGKWWTIGANADVVESRDDNIYRKAIKAKIIRNNGYATSEEIIELAKQITNSTDIILENDFPAGIKIYYNGELTDYERQYAGEYIQASLGAGILLTDIQPIEE